MFVFFDVVTAGKDLLYLWKRVHFVLFATFFRNRIFDVRFVSFLGVSYFRYIFVGIIWCKTYDVIYKKPEASLVILYLKAL